MKKLLCIIMVFVILSGLCACHVQEESTKSTESTGSSQNSGMMPRRVMVYSEEAWTAVIDSAKLSDAAFAEFVVQASADPDDQISIPRDTEKQEVEALVQLLATVGIPMLKSNVKPEKIDFEYRPESSWLQNLYIIDGIKYLFTICPHNGNFIHSKGEADVVWTIEEDSISLNRDGRFLRGNLYRGDYVIWVEIFEAAGGKTENNIDLQTIAPIEFVWDYALGDVE